jgi:No apical meristem-associated C-terminal domain
LTSTNKFNSLFRQRKRQNPSGTTDEDIINMAMEDYKVQNDGKEYYKFRHCLKILWKSPKFDVTDWRENFEMEGSFPANSRPPSRAAASPRTSTDEDGAFDHDDGSPQAHTPRVNDVTANMQGITKERPMGTKNAKELIRQAERREFWNKKRDKRMRALTKATNRASKVLEFSAFQQAINARVGHYILLGQNKKALELMRETADGVQLPPQEAADDDEDSDDEELEDAVVGDKRLDRDGRNRDDDDEDHSDADPLTGVTNQEEV